jgi:hypothetical protein
MRPIEKRLAELEEGARDTRPFMVWQDGDQRPAIPKDIGNRPVMFVRWLRAGEPHLDVAMTPKGNDQQ